MSARDDFATVLAQLGEKFDTTLALDDADACILDCGEGDAQQEVHFQYLPKSDMVVLWATVGMLAQDRNDVMRRAYLLQMQDMFLDTFGFTLGSEPGTRRLVAMARRPPAAFDEPAALEAWVDMLVHAIERVRTVMDENFPVEMEDLDADDLAQVARIWSDVDHAEEV